MEKQEELWGLKKITLVVAIVTSFSSAYILSAVNVALPVIGDYFGMTATMQGWVTTSVLLVTGTMMVPVGRLADIYGRKRFFLSGLILTIIGTLLCGMANSGWMIIFTRVIQGLGSSMILGPLMAIITSVFPGEERGKALGISVAATYSGLTVGPFLGGVLTQYLGWRSIFFFGTLMSTLSIVLAVIKLRGEWREAEGERFDIAGSLLFAFSLVVLIYGFTSLPRFPGFVMLIIGLLGLIIFVWFEGRIKSPILNVGILGRNKVFVFSNIATMINYSATFALSFLISLYLQYIRGYAPQEAGLILLVNPATMAFFAPISGRLSDRFQPQIMAAVGMGLSCGFLILLSFLGQASGLAFISVLLVFSGLASALFSTPNTNAIMGSVEKRFLGVAAGTQGTTRTVGMVFSMGIVMILFTIFMGEVQITPEYYPAFLASFKISFIIFAILNFFGIFCQLAGRKQIK